MSEIVERLRTQEYFSDELMAARSDADADLIDRYRSERREAADKIERLTGQAGEPVAWRWRFEGENDDQWMVRRAKPPTFVEPEMRIEIQPLYAAPPMPGWQATPSEPTDDMCKAMIEKINEAKAGGGAPFEWPDVEHMYDIYRAALRAMPAPPEAREDKA